MIYLQPFFLLMGRAAVFWVGAAVLLALSFLLAGIGQPDEITAPYVDAVFLAALGFPAVAGWLAGEIIQEFLHCSFAWPLPSVLRRLASGFVVSGLTISLVVAALASQSSASSHGFLTLLALGLAGYGLCGNYFSSQKAWLGWVNLLVLILLVTRSRYLSELAADHRLATLAISLGIAIVGSLRLFSRSDFRRRAFRLSKPFPGTYSLERSVDYEREKRVKEGPRRTSWTARYLGVGSWNWIRATLHTHGPIGWRTVPKALNPLWVLGLLLATNAWSDKGALSFGEALGKTVYGALFGSPHVPAFGQDSDRHPIVILVIAAMGAVLALWSPADLKTSLAYPLSRRQLATVTHGVGLFGTGIFFAEIFLVLTVTGHLAGWLVGYPIRIDFMPFFLDPLLVTVILMPLAYWGRLYLQVATQRKTDNTLISVIFGVVGFVAAVWIWTALMPWLFSGPMMELSVMALLILLSQYIYRRRLRSYFSTADLI